MAWIKVETSVARNRKFVQAGPGPSWLWLCGLAYCQEGLTDGFIPREAVDYLGVKSAGHLARHLVSSGLWDVVDGGWQVHDYLDHNRSASDVAGIKARRAAGGHLGGRPKKHPNGNLHETSKVSSEETLPVDVAVDVADAASVAGVEKRKETVSDRFERWWSAYPRKVGKDAALKEWLRRSPDAALTDLMIAKVLEQRASTQWLKDGGEFIPHPRTWLHQGRWTDEPLRSLVPAAARALDPSHWASCSHTPKCGSLRQCIEKNHETRETTPA